MAEVQIQWPRLLRTAMVLYIVIASLHGVSGDVPDGVVFTDLDKTIEQGDRVVLKCRFYGKPFGVYWKKGDDPVTSPNLITWVDGESPSGSCVLDGACEMDDNFSLIIKEARIADQGRYICRVSNYLGILIHNVTDIVIFAPPEEPYPIINECQEMMLMNPMDTCNISSHIPINITCSATNYFPDIDLFFLCDSQEVITLETKELVNDDGTKNKSVVISSLNGETTYVCVASDVPGSEERRTAGVVVNLQLDATMLSQTTVSSVQKKDQCIVIIVTPISFFTMLVAVIAFIFAMYCRKKEAGKYDIEEAVGDHQHDQLIIKGKVSFYEVWFLVYGTGKEDDDELGHIPDTLCKLGISHVETGLNKALAYDALCDWKENNSRDTQAMDLKQALLDAGDNGSWKKIYDERHLLELELPKDTLEHILWHIGDPEKINRFLGHLIPGIRISVAGKMEDIIKGALIELNQWSNNPFKMNPLVLLSLALERASCSPVDREFFTVPDKLMEEISEHEVIEFTQRLTRRHCVNLVECSLYATDALDTMLNKNDEASLYNTKAMILDWIAKEECSNFEKRHRLNVAALKAGRQDVKGHFRETHLHVSAEEDDEQVHQTEAPCGQSLESPGACHMEGKLYQIELFDIAFRLLMTDILSIAEALGISHEKLPKYKPDFSPKQLSNGTFVFLVKNTKYDRIKIRDALFKAGYKDIASLVNEGYANSLADLFSLAYGPVPNSSQRSQIRQNLKIAVDQDDFIAMLKQWRYMVHHPSYNPRTALADAVRPILGDEKASAIMSGTSRRSGIHSENVIIEVRKGILFKEVCRMTEILGLPLPTEEENPITMVMNTLEYIEKKSLLTKETCSKLKEAGFKQISSQLNKVQGDIQEDEGEDVRKRREKRLQCDVSSRLAEVLGIKKSASSPDISSVIAAWEDKLRKSPLKEDKRRDLSDRLLSAGFDEFAHEIMTGFVPRPADKK